MLQFYCSMYFEEKMKIIKVFKNLDCTKMLLKLDDGYVIENCFKYPFWMCITTQVGCPIGCHFCHSGKNGFKRNLTTKEMMDQIIIAIEYSIGNFTYDYMFSTISFTGMGEPLLNVTSVVEVIRELQAKTNVEISLTTTGILNNIQKLFFTKKKIAIDISMHSLDPNKRKLLIPTETKYPIESTIQYMLKNINRFQKISFDYLLLQGINDSLEDLLLLISSFKKTNIHIELKRYNRLNENDTLKASTEEVFSFFYKNLKKHGITASIEENVGIEFNAGCGQLVWSYYETLNKE